MLLTICRRAISVSRRPPCSAPRSSLRTSAIFRRGMYEHSRTARYGILAAGGALVGSGYIYWKRKGVSAEHRTDQGIDHQHSARGQASLASLVRAYVVYSMCSVPVLVDYSPAIFSAIMSIPGVSYLAEAFVRTTFFSQFVGGDTAIDTLPVLAKLRGEIKGTLLAYSVEVDEGEAAGKTKPHGQEFENAQPVYKQIVEEMIHCIDVAADFEDQLRKPQNEAIVATGRRTWVAVKLSALLPDAQALINFSKHLVNTRPPSARPVCFPGSPRPSDFDVLFIDPINLPETSSLTTQDLEALKELKDDLSRICRRARERGVKIIIDAEYSWYQPAIDAYQRALMAEFNHLPRSRSPPSILSNLFRREPQTSSADLRHNYTLVQPLVYGTFQAYLRRTPEHLVQSLLDAEAGNYALGVKLVRGAYHPFEVSAHETRKLRDSGNKSHPSAGVDLYCPSISPDVLSPVWEDKAETDANYNACARMLIKHVADELAPIRTRQSRDGSRGRQHEVPKLGILFGTHNWESVGNILDAFVDGGLATRTYHDDSEVIHVGDEAAERITLGQLYGTRDALTNYLVNKTISTEPFVIKYVPYGKLSEVMPYLGRRAIENKSILGNGVAEEERREAGAEIIKRFWGLFK